VFIFHSLQLSKKFNSWFLVTASLKVPIRDLLKVIPMKAGKDFLHTRKPSVNLPAIWVLPPSEKHQIPTGRFTQPCDDCIGQPIIQDVEHNPVGEDIFTR